MPSNQEIEARLETTWERFAVPNRSRFGNEFVEEATLLSAMAQMRNARASDRLANIGLAVSITSGFLAFVQVVIAIIDALHR